MRPGVIVRRYRKPIIHIVLLDLHGSGFPHLYHIFVTTSSTRLIISSQIILPLRVAVLSVLIYQKTSYSC